MLSVPNKGSQGKLSALNWGRFNIVIMASFCHKYIWKIWYLRQMAIYEAPAARFLTVINMAGKVVRASLSCWAGLILNFFYNFFFFFSFITKESVGHHIKSDLFCILLQIYSVYSYGAHCTDERYWCITHTMYMLIDKEKALMHTIATSQLLYCSNASKTLHLKKFFWDGGHYL